MKSNDFLYTTAIVLIARLVNWITTKPTLSLLHWWQTFLDWHHTRRRRRRRKRMQRNNKMYEFRPFQLQQCDYKSYNSAKTGKGINYIPKARSGHRIAATETDLFCFGGYNPDNTDNTLFAELLKFNVLTQRWSRVFTSSTEKMPREYVSNAVAMVNDIMVLFGGTGYPFGEKRSNKTYLMWPYSWQNKQILLLQTSGDKPEPVYGQAILLRDNYLYVIGGTTGHEFTCDIYRLDLSARTWECCYRCNENLRDSDPKGRYRHEIAHDDNYIYIFGGGTQDQSFDLEVIPAYSFKDNKYVFVRTKPDSNVEANGGYPEPRRFHSLIQHTTDDGSVEVVIAGGYKSEAKTFDDIWKLNLRTLQWRRFTTKLPYALYFHDAATTGNGLMYIFGGVTGSNRLRTNDLHKIWVKIPKLNEICWDALIKYDPKIVDKDKVELLSMGIPPKFADRVARNQFSGGLNF